MPWAEVYEFAEPLVDLRHEPDHAETFRRELLRELSPGHPLHDLAVTVIARALPQDDVIVETQDAVALVHLTWTGKPEPLPWPLTEWVNSAEHLHHLIEFRYD
jgi:hypothetical protein